MLRESRTVRKLLPFAFGLLTACGGEILEPEATAEEASVSEPEPPLPPGLTRDDPAFAVESVGSALRSETPTVPYGGGGGGAFNWKANENWRLVHVRLRCGLLMDSIEAWWRDKNNELKYSGRAGGPGGPTTVDIDLRGNETIVSAHGWTDSKHVARLGFKTSAGRAIACTNYTPGTGGLFPKPGFTNDGPDTFVEHPRPGMAIHGFHGRAGKWLDQIGFYYYKP